MQASRAMNRRLKFKNSGQFDETNKIARLLNAWHIYRVHFPRFWMPATSSSRSVVGSKPSSFTSSVR